jgi:hypothetical protein
MNNRIYAIIFVMMMLEGISRNYGNLEKLAYNPSFKEKLGNNKYNEKIKQFYAIQKENKCQNRYTQIKSNKIYFPRYPNNYQNK